MRQTNDDDIACDIAAPVLGAIGGGLIGGAPAFLLAGPVVAAPYGISGAVVGSVMARAACHLVMDDPRDAGPGSLPPASAIENERAAGR